MSNLSLYGGAGFGQPSKAVIRQMSDALTRVDMQATVAHAKATAVGNVGAAAVGMMGNLAELGTSVVKQTPAAAPYIDLTMRSVAITMSNIVNDLGRL
jgi:hypothetical protein